MSKKRILIIDDEADIAGALKFFLEKTGMYEVQIEQLGQAGVEAAETFRPDLILLDVMMPDMDGGDVAAQIGENKATNRIPIVFLTAAVTKEEVDAQGGTIGERPVLSKMTSLEQLIAYVKKALEVVS